MHQWVRRILLFRRGEEIGLVTKVREKTLTELNAVKAIDTADIMNESSESDNIL